LRINAFNFTRYYKFEVLDDTQTITIAHNYDAGDGTVVTNNSAVDILGTANDIIISPLSTNDNEFKNSLSIYPNPASDKLFIKKNQSSYQIKSIRINSIDGKLVKSVSALNGNNSLDISNLSGALYFMTVTSEDDYKATYKFLVKK